MSTCLLGGPGAGPDTHPAGYPPAGRSHAFSTRVLALSLFLTLAGCATTGTDAPAPEDLDALPAPRLAEDPALAGKALRDAGLDGDETRVQASNARAAEAWELLGEGEFEPARQRFNQSLMLNPDNFHPYWGFGQLALERGRTEEAVRNLEKAMELIDDPRQEVVLLSDAGTAYSILGESARYDGDAEAARRAFARGNRLFEQSARLEPGYGNTYRWWAMALYRERRYRDAWRKVELARRNGAEPLPAGFLDALGGKMSRPW